jgi:GNAT superfamily N-acetyltransferase
MTDFVSCPDVRLAVPEDLSGVMELMRRACSEDAQHEMDEDKVLAMVVRHYEKQGVMLAVIGEIGEPVAYVLSELCPLWYSNEWQLLELSLFVHPDHRRSTYAKQLIRFMKAASDGLKLDLTIGVFSHTKTEAKVRLYARNLPQVGAFFCYRPSAESNT